MRLSHHRNFAASSRPLSPAQLENGEFISVGSGLVRRLKQHFVTLPCGVDAILGLNGYIWITESMTSSAGAGAGAGSEGFAKLSVGLGGAMLDADDEAAAAEGLAEAMEKMKRLAAERVIGADGRVKIARVRNAITLLARNSMPIFPDAIMAIYNTSLHAGLAPADMAHPANAALLLGRGSGSGADAGRGAGAGAGTGGRG